MKIKAIILLFFLIAGSLQYLQAQNPLVFTLCYDEEYTEKISVVSDLEPSTLTILDKLKFKNKKYDKQHHEYINGTGYATHDLYFVSHENMFPEWYTHPSIIRSNEAGAKSYFHTRNDYLIDGWTGGTKSRTEHGEYIEDVSTGERYLFQPHSVKANEAYQSWNNWVKSVGFLERYTFSYPSESELDNLKTEGYEVTINNNLIKVNNTSVIMAWDIVEKISILQYTKGTTPIETIKTYYQYNDNFDSHLVHRIVKTTPETFENGNCYETISYTTYSNYASDCKPKDMEYKSKSADNEIDAETEISKQLEIYPNPATDQLTIKIPKSDLGFVMQVTNVIGEIIIHRKIDNNMTSLNLKISELPSGVYIINLLQGKNSYSSKFVKQ